MSNAEKIFITLLFIGLGALVLWEYAKPPLVPAAAANPTNDPAVQPAYLSYATPYAFGPPVQNFLPKSSVGQTGQTSRKISCGC